MKFKLKFLVVFLSVYGVVGLSLVHVETEQEFVERQLAAYDGDDWLTQLTEKR